ncbi:uncharacterized protein TNCV_3277241 [Trichonephila clavipes]|nr:uncharacterized protein TNCV_3277241 [Trichonephila clavipes]
MFGGAYRGLVVRKHPSIYPQSLPVAAPVVKESDHGKYVMSSSPVPLKTRRVGQRCTLNLSRAETSSQWCGRKERGVPTQVSSSLLDHGSKLGGPSPKPSCS